MASTRSLMCGISCLAFGALAAGGAQAQSALEGAARAETPSKPASRTPDSAAMIAELVVVADKRQDVLINVPVAASALGYAQLQQYATADLQSIASQMPQIQIQPTGGATSGAALSIRGVGSLAADYSNDQPVGLVIDGVPLARGHAVDLGAFDVEQVQVLEGPQALFFGKNSPAGVVAMTTVNPGATLQGYARAGYAIETRMPFLEGAVSIPITDTFAIRLAGRYRDMHRGYVKNLAQPIADPFPGETSFTLPGAGSSTRGKQEQAIGRLTATWRPSESFDATLKLTVSDYEDDGQSLLAGVSACAPGNLHPTTTNLLAPTFSFQDPFGPCTLKDGKVSKGNAPPQVVSNFVGAPADGQPFTSNRLYLAGLNLNYVAGDVTLTSVSGFYDATQKGYDNYDGSVYGQALNAQPRDHDRVFTQELRAASDFDGPLNFNAGAFFEHENQRVVTTNKIFPLGVFTGPGPFNGKYNTLYTTAGISKESYSVFGQLKWDITPTVELAGGARWSHDERAYTQVALFNRLEAVLPAAFNPFAPAGRVFNTKTDHSDVSPELTLTWRPRAGLTLYGAYKEGYLAGGVSTPASLSNYDVLCARAAGCTDPASLLLYQPQVAKGGEFGAKGTFLGGSLYADATVYRYRFNNLQVTAFDSATTAFFTRNAASALSQGFSAKVRYNVTPDFQVRGYVAYTDLHYRKYQNAQCYTGQAAATGCVGGVQDLSGKSYGGPPWDFNLGVNYRRALSADWSLGLAGDVYCHTRAPRGLHNPNDPGGDAYCTQNASLRLHQESGPLELAVIGTNLSDDRHVLPSGVGKPLGAPGDLQGIVSPGRQVTLQATYRF